MAIADTWWWFLVVLGGVAVLVVISAIVEKLQKNEDILKINPILVLFKILFAQAIFNALYFFVAFSIDITFNELFYVTQLYHSAEFSFSSLRGILNLVALAIALASSTPIVLSVARYKDIVDHCFTLCFLHFVTVSIVMLDFPMSGAWWTALGIGFIVLTAIAKYSVYKLETMPYKSNMARSKRRKRANAMATGDQEGAAIALRTLSTTAIAPVAAASSSGFPVSNINNNSSSGITISSSPIRRNSLRLSTPPSKASTIAAAASLLSSSATPLASHLGPTSSPRESSSNMLARSGESARDLIADHGNDSGVIMVPSSPVATPYHFLTSPKPNQQKQDELVILDMGPLGTTDDDDGEYVPVTVMSPAPATPVVPKLQPPPQPQSSSIASPTCSSTTTSSMTAPVVIASTAAAAAMSTSAGSDSTLAGSSPPLHSGAPKHRRTISYPAAAAAGAPANPANLTIGQGSSPTTAPSSLPANSFFQSPPPTATVDLIDLDLDILDTTTTSAQHYTHQNSLQYPPPPANADAFNQPSSQPQQNSFGATQPNHRSFMS